MKFKIIFKQKNPDFDIEYANQYHFGKESENNLKDLWIKTYDLVNDVNEYYISENDKYHLVGTLTTGVKINEFIPNMKILKCFDEEKNEIGIYGVSENLVDKTHKAFDKKHNITRYYFYLNPNEEFVELKNGVFVNTDDIPEKMIELKS